MDWGGGPCCEDVAEELGFGLVAFEGGLDDDDAVDVAGASGGGGDDEDAVETVGVDAGGPEDAVAVTGVDTFAASSSLMNFST